MSGQFEAGLKLPVTYHVVIAFDPEGEGDLTPYVKSNNNYRNDGEAICEAVGRPSMRVVPCKSTIS